MTMPPAFLECHYSILYHTLRFKLHASTSLNNSRRRFFVKTRQHAERLLHLIVTQCIDKLDPISTCRERQ